MTHTFNLPFQTGTSPEKMKIDKVIPRSKSGSKGDFNNYIPISLLRQFSKILERQYSNSLHTFTKNVGHLESLSVWLPVEMSTTSSTCKSSV